MNSLSQTSSPLVDTFGRHHNNLRISITDRCNIRCFYCMPEHDPVFIKRDQILSYEEIVRFVGIAARLGINKVRLTGGEPLVRRNLPALVGQIQAIPQIEDLALTTNGLLLLEHAEKLFDAGLRRLNVHLDTLNAEKFRTITRRDGVDRVVRAILLCKELGFGPIKINAVAVKGMIEDDIVPLVQFGRENGVEVRFIEFMPLDADGNWKRDEVLPAEDVLDILSNGIGPLHAMTEQDPSAPASDYVFDDGVGRVGIIASVSNPFCMSCNRIRLTSDGKLRNCLFANEEIDVRSLLRSESDDEAIVSAIQASIQSKKEGHEINMSRFQPPQRPMYAIGG